jgi:hypothetical protein
MNIIQGGKDGEVGIVSDAQDLKDVGDFAVANLKKWLNMISLVLGDDDDIRIRFKLSEDELTPAYVIFASHDGMDPMVVVCGKYRNDGKGWDEE